MSKYAPATDGLYPYVVETTSWGNTTSRIEWASSLADARKAYGCTHMHWKTVTVRRARRDELEAARP